MYAGMNCFKVFAQMLVAAKKTAVFYFSEVASLFIYADCFCNITLPSFVFVRNIIEWKVIRAFQEQKMTFSTQYSSEKECQNDGMNHVLIDKPKV